MGKSRSERRAIGGRTLNLFSANTALGWTVVRQVAVEYALEQLALEKWREIWFEGGELAGVQPLRAPLPDERKCLHRVLIERLAAATITLSELKRNAGLFGRSHTMGMPEWKRLRRHARFDPGKILDPEDATERAIEKVRLWPYPASRIDDGSGEPVYGDKAVRVYPPVPKTAVRR